MSETNTPEDRPTTPEEIEADIERQRAELSATVDQLQHKLDVKARGKDKVEDVKARTQDKVVDLKDRATTNDGKPRPEVAGGAAAVVALLVGLVILRQRSKRKNRLLG